VSVILQQVLSFVFGLFNWRYNAFMDLSQSQMMYEKRLDPGQRCPLCGKEAKGFDFTEFGDILKEKWCLKKSIGRSKEQEEILRENEALPKMRFDKHRFSHFLPPFHLEMP
jgi:hypothetical protein